MPPIDEPEITTSPEDHDLPPVTNIATEDVTLDPLNDSGKGKSRQQLPPSGKGSDRDAGQGSGSTLGSDATPDLKPDTTLDKVLHPAQDTAQSEQEGNDSSTEVNATIKARK